MDKEVLRKRDRGRHVRALWYVCVCLTMSLFCYLVLDFSRLRALGYCVAAFAILNLASRRQMFSKGPAGARRNQDR